TKTRPRYWRYRVQAITPAPASCPKLSAAASKPTNPAPTPRYSLPMAGMNCRVGKASAFITIVTYNSPKSIGLCRTYRTAMARLAGAGALGGGNRKADHEPQCCHMHCQDAAVGAGDPRRLEQHTTHERSQHLAESVIQHVQGQGVDEPFGPDEIEDGRAPCRVFQRFRDPLQRDGEKDLPRLQALKHEQAQHAQSRDRAEQLRPHQDAAAVETVGKQARKWGT